MAFRLPTGDELNLPSVPTHQQSFPTGGDEALDRAQEAKRQTIGNAITQTIDLAGKVLQMRQNSKLEKAQTEYVDKMSQVETDIELNPTQSLEGNEDVAFPNYQRMVEERERISKEVQDEYLGGIFSGSNMFAEWRKEYDRQADSRIKKIDIATQKKIEYDNLVEGVETFVRSTSAQNEGQQREALTGKISRAVENGIISPVEGDDLLDDAYEDMRRNAIRTEVEKYIAEEDFRKAEEVVADPNTYVLETYDGKKKYMGLEQQNAFTSWVESEKEQHKHKLRQQEEKIAREQHKMLVDDWVENSPEKMQFLIQDSDKYSTYFKQNPRQYERWMLNIDEIKKKKAEEARARRDEASSAEARAEAEAKAKALERRREYAVKDIERKIESGVDHDEVDRLITRYAKQDLFDSDLMSEYYRRNESRNPDPVRESLYTQIDNLDLDEPEKAKIQERLQGELARMDMQGDGGNLSMSDAQQMFDNIKEPVVEGKVRNLIDNRVVEGFTRKAGRSIWSDFSDIAEGVDLNEKSLTSREQLNRSLYQDKILYGTANPNVISTVAFEENLGNEEEIYSLVAPNFEDMSNREQNIVTANVNAGIVAREQFNDFSEKWGADRIKDTYITGLGTLVIETDYARFRRITPKDSMQSKWQIKTKGSDGSFSEVWQDYGGNS